MDRFDIGRFGDSRLQKGGAGLRGGWRRLVGGGCRFARLAARGPARCARIGS